MAEFMNENMRNLKQDQSTKLKIFWEKCAKEKLL